MGDLPRVHRASVTVSAGWLCDSITGIFLYKVNVKSSKSTGVNTQSVMSIFQLVVLALLCREVQAMTLLQLVQLVNESVQTFPECFKAIIFWICQFLLALWPLLKSVFFLILERFLIIKLRNVRFFLSFILCDSPRIGPISSFPGWVFVPGSQKVVLTPHHWCSKSGSWADKPHSCFLGLCFIHSRTTLHLWTWSKVKFILNFKKCHCCV